MGADESVYSREERVQIRKKTLHRRHQAAMQTAINILLDAQFKLKQDAKAFMNKAKKYRNDAAVALKRGQYKAAQSYGELVITQRKQSETYTLLSIQMINWKDRVQEGMSMTQIQEGMVRASHGLATALARMSPSEMATQLNQFERLCDGVAETTEMVKESFSDTSEQRQPAKEVHSLMCELADEHHLDIKTQLDDMATTPCARPLADVAAQQTPLVLFDLPNASNLRPAISPTDHDDGDDD